MSLAIFSLLFQNAANVLVLDPETNAAATLGSVYMLYSILNLVTIAVLVASPFIAQALVANTPAVAGVVAPFVGAALAAGTVTAKASTAAGEKAGRGIASRFGNMFEGTKGPAASAPKSRASLTSPATSAPVGATSQGGVSGEGTDSDTVQSSPAQPTSSTDDGLAKSRRDRRNAIIKQTLKRR
jgi:type IV secretory pathway TrbL component